MRKKLTLIFLPLLLVLTFLTQYNSAYAQAYTENFNDTGTLAGSGWYRQNNSSPKGILGWFQGTPPTASGPFTAYQGSDNAYIAANFNSTGSVGTISNWLVSPTRTLRNGDVFSFYTRKPDGLDYPDRLEVRLSTNGASTNVGTTATAVGDFTTLLLSVNPTLIAGVYPKTWTQYTITISGLPAPVSGRIAFRYFVTNAGSGGTNSDYIGIDEVSYVPYVCPVLTITTASLPNATSGVAYSQSLSQTGALGAPGYSLTAGALPPGLTLSSAGLLSGTPMAQGTFNFTVALSDASGCSGSKAFSITTNCGANPINFPAQAVCANTPLILDMATPAGGIYSGPGVAGHTFDPSAGSQTISYTYTDPGGCTHTATAPITVLEPSITTVTGGSVCSPGGVVNLSATGNGTISWYDAPVGGNLVHTGNTYSPSISANTTYYVESQVMSTASKAAPMPTHTTAFGSNVRGYYFIAPKSFIITSLIVPTEAGAGNQSIAVVKFNNNTAPPRFDGTTNDFTTLFLTQNNTQATKIAVSIPVQQGEVIGILGSRGTFTSYSSSGFTTDIDGIPVTLTRMGMQYPLSTTAPKELWSEEGGSIGRVFFEYAPVCTSSPRTPVPATISAGPEGTASIPAQQICSGGNINPVILSGSAGTTFNWTRNNTAAVTGIAASGSGDIIGTLTNTTQAPATVTFTVTPVNGTCIGAPITVTITVNPIPAVSAVFVPASATYEGGQKLNFTVQYTENVLVDVTGGTPYITITLNTGGKVQAQYISGSGTSTLTFEYIVTPTDQDPDGIVVGNNVNLNGGTIESINGCASTTALNNLPSTTGIKIHNPVPQIITFNALPVVTYGDDDFDPSVTSNSGLEITLTSSNAAVATIVNGKIHIVGAGTSVITASQSGDGNYLPATPVQQALVVNRKHITVTVDAQSKEYGDADPALTYTYAPALVGSDAFTGAISRTAGENAGNYAIVQNTLALNENYQLTYIAANLVITKAVLTATAGDKTVCVNTSAGTIPVSYSGFKNGETISAISSQPVVQVPAYYSAGNYALTPSGGSATNYSFSYVSGQLTVQPIPEGNIAQTETGAGVVNGFKLTAPAGIGYAWSTGETTSAITVKSSGNYFVVVTNEYGCSKRFDQQISLQTISIPNTFSPNGDGINDYWQIPELANYPQAYVTIINRDGQVVFESRNFTRWDGRYRGQLLPAGVYFYRVRKAPGTEPVTGWLNLLR